MRIVCAVVILSLAPGMSSAAELEGALAACRALADDDQRLACYDGIGAPPVPPVVAEAEPEPPVQEAEPAEPEAELPPVPAPAPVEAAPVAAAVPTPEPEDTFGKSAGEIRREQQESFGLEEVRQLEAKVVKLKTMGNRKLQITLDNGQVWHQVSSSYLRLKVGDDIVIKRAALDSYRLVKVGNNRAMQVRRRG